jgi:hypothetical protein
MDIPVSISGDFKNLHAQAAEGPPISPKGIDPLHGLPRTCARWPSRTPACAERRGESEPGF